MNKYVYEGQLKSAAYKDTSEFAPSSHSHAAKDLSFSEKNTNYTNASNIQDAIEDIDAKLWDTVGQVDQIAEDYSNHRSDNNIHISSAEKSNWNKPTFSILMDNSANTYEATKIGDCVEFYGQTGVNVEIQNGKNPEGGPSVLISNTGVIGVKGEKENDFKSGYVSLSAANIGLGNVNNTSDKDKPISSATQNALDLLENKQIQQKAEGSCPILDNTVVIINQIPISTDSSGNIYNSIGYKNGYRWSSSGKAETTGSGYGITGFIPYQVGNQLRLKNVSTAVEYPYVVCFTENKTVLGVYTISATPDENGVISLNITNWQNVAFIRLSLGAFSDISIATVNQDLNLGGNANIGWLMTASNERIAPKTLVSQVVTPDLLPLDEWIDGKLEIIQGDIDRSTYGVQEHLINNDLHIVVGERTKWTTAAETITNKESKWDTAYTHSQSTHAPANAEKNQNAYDRFGFTNATSTYASAPSEGDESFVVEAQSTNHKLEFIAGNSLIEFNPTDGSYGDSVEIYIHADPAGAAEEAETNAKAYADEVIANKQDKEDDSLRTIDKTIVGAINEVKKDIDDIEKNQYNILESAGLIGRDEITITDLSSYNPTWGFITNTGTWSNINEKYQFKVIPISNTGSTLSITANDSCATYFAGLRSYTTPVDKIAIDLSEADGWTSRLVVPKSATKQYNIPDDVKYLIIFVVYNTSDCIPASFYLNIPYGRGRVDILEEKVDILENGHKLKWLALGDSITEGYYSVLDENTEDTESHKSIDECYCAWIAKMKGFDLDNKGVGGSGWLKRGTAAAPKLNSREQIDALNEDGTHVIDFTKYDICTIMWGVNDWKGSQNLGVFEDGVNPETESVYGNMRYVIETILSRNPNIKLIIITPVNCRQDTSARPSSADNNWGIGFEFGGHTLDDYYNAIKEVCEYYGIEMIDMLHNSVINRINAEILLPDKVHPSLEAHRKIGLDLAGKILFGN